MDPEDLESWRVFFRTSGFDIFVIINKAIMVAAKDHALHLKLRRDQIVSLLYHHCCSCDQPNVSFPLEGTNFFQPNVDSYCRNCFIEDGYQDKSNRMGHVDFSLPMEPNKSFMVECNGEEKMVEPADVVDGSIKETAAGGDEDRSQRVGHQDQTLLLTLAKSNAVKQSRKSEKLDSDGGFNREEINDLENLDKHIYVQDGLNKSTTVEGSSDLEMDGFNCISNVKDDDLLESLNKTFADQTDGFEKETFDVTSNGKCGGFCEGQYKNPTETNHSAVDRETSLFQMGGCSSEQAVAMKDLVSVGDETSKEVLKVKTILDDWKNQPDVMLLKLLMKLESLDLNYKILEDTLIGRVVCDLRKHGTKEIRGAARSLIRGWKNKVDEWIRVNAQVEAAEDHLPSGTLNERDTVSPALAELLQTFEDVDVREFFSILQPENTQGNFYLNEELGYAEKELIRITNSGRIDMSDKIREEDLPQQPLPLLNLSSISENKQPGTDKDELERFDDTKIMEEKDSMTKLGSYFPLGMPKSMGNRTIKVKNNASEDAFTEHRVISSLNVCNVQKLKQTAVGKGRDRKEIMVKKPNVISKSQIKPKEHPKESNIAKFELKMEKSNCSRQSLKKQPEKVRISQSNELEKVEETRTKLQEGCKNCGDVKKRRAIYIVNVNHLHPKELKREKNQHSRGEEGCK